ncbi:MAG: hypothetical protein H0V88_15215 [Pyrinomonadaceae bacterium]|nr:hypothetical protein [Pyrinomonadaceae bacterium]
MHTSAVHEFFAAGSPVTVFLRIRQTYRQAWFIFNGQRLTLQSTVPIRISVRPIGRLD